MNVHLTFDVEVWCNGWQHLDRDFPAAFERYVFGTSRHGQYALPTTLEILNRHGLRAVFFVEPLFAARFGQRYLQRIVSLIEDAGQEVQLHLHPEWTDEIRPLPLPNVSQKRQHLCHYSRDEQTSLIAFGLELLRSHAQGPINAFRAGSYAVNADTYHALRSVGIEIDSSLNQAFAVSGCDIPERADPRSVFRVSGVTVVPITVFRDGLGRKRSAQVGACGLAEMRQAMSLAHQQGRRHFVFVSHNFEMLKPGRSDPDRVVVRRFEGLCRHLAIERGRYRVGAFEIGGESSADARALPTLSSPWATLGRLVAQAVRRLP